MSTVALNVVAVKVGATILNFESGSVTLDEGWAPYAQADLTVTIPDSVTLAALDPMSGIRVTIDAARSVLAGSAFAPQSSRTFDLAVTSRTVDHNANTVQLHLDSDEALLQHWALVSTTPDTSALTYQSSVRSIVNNVILSKIGASLAAGTTDADFTTLTSVTNLLPDPGGESNPTSWVSAGNTNLVARTTTVHRSGASCVQVNSGGGSFNVAPVAAGNAIAVQPGQTVTFAFYDMSAGSIRKVQGVLRFFNSSGAQVGTDTFGTQVTESATDWEHVTVTAVAPAGAAKVWPYIGWDTSGSNETHYVDDAMLTLDNGLDTDGQPYEPFSGDTADTSLYYYTWTATQFASTSTRTPVFQRDPDALAWQPGTSAWDFITPVLQTAGLRLFCDESRTWQLVDSTYTIPGRVTVASGFNAFAASDTISLDATADDGSPLWFDAVIVKYSWTDEAGAQQVKYDVASSDAATKARLIEYDRPYPGPGAANHILQRVQGQGHTLSLTAAVDFNATPGMEVSTTLPNIDDQLGYTSSISWDLQADAMTVGTRGLIDLGEFAWGLIPAGISSDDIPAGLHYPDAVDWSSI